MTQNQWKIFKFGAPDGEDVIEYCYHNTCCIQTISGFERVLAAPRSGQIDFILDILGNFTPPFGCLYMLVAPRGENQPGRYQCPYPLDYDELRDFVLTFRDFLEADGRHYLWIGSVSDSRQKVIYDRHNVIYIYGDAPKTLEFVKGKGLSEGTVTIPEEHTHFYHEDFDRDETDLLDYWNWKRFPLEEQDLQSF